MDKDRSRHFVFVNNRGRHMEWSEIQVYEKSMEKARGTRDNKNVKLGDEPKIFSCGEDRLRMGVGMRLMRYTIVANK